MMSKHYDAWSYALSVGLLSHYAAIYRERQRQFLVAQFQELLSASLSPLRLFYETTNSDESDYSFAPCDCAMCRPVGGRTHYDC